MAKVQTDEIKERFGRFARYTVRLAPIIVVVGAIGWFFLLRSPGGQTNTSGSTNSPDTTPETTVSTTTAKTKPQAKVPDNSTTLSETTDDGGKAESGKLPETGPADTLAIFAVTATAGTLFWEWRLRRPHKLNPD